MSLGLRLLVAAAMGSVGLATAAKQFYTIVEASVQPAPLHVVQCGSAPRRPRFR